MKFFFTIVFFTTSLFSNAQNEQTVAYINQFKEIAIQEMIRTGVPAAIKLGQGILESQSGESALVKRSNNHFGIKCKTEWTGAKTYHNDDAKGECFRVYDDATASYKDHSDFLRTRPHYNFLFSLNPTDYSAWAYGLKKAGYATAPTYPQKLIKVIEDYQLNQYNIIALARTKETQEKIVPVDKPILSNTAPNKKEVVDQQNLEQLDDKSESETITPNEVKIKIATQKNTEYPTGIFTINQTNVIYASEGTSMLALANQYNITLSKLIDFNEMSETDVLLSDQLIYLERKQKKGAVDFYMLKDGENITQVSQLMGVRLENILQYNGLNKMAPIKSGTKIYLKPSTDLKATTKQN
jgi:Mannosyl-glycoprotein endo-beta-N-acetylglucosaminidase/LysM domain